jgi:hypothetical protein
MRPICGHKSFVAPNELQTHMMRLLKQSLRRHFMIFFELYSPKLGDSMHTDREITILDAGELLLRISGSSR